MALSFKVGDIFLHLQNKRTYVIKHLQHHNKNTTEGYSVESGSLNEFWTEQQLKGRYEIKLSHKLDILIRTL